MPTQVVMFDEPIDWQARLSEKKSAKFEMLYTAQLAALELYSKRFLNEAKYCVRTSDRQRQDAHCADDSGLLAKAAEASCCAMWNKEFSSAI
jgi:hypothetical protein